MFEAPAVVAGFDDVAMVGNTVEQCGGHLGVAKDGRPDAEPLPAGADRPRGPIDPDRGAQAVLNWGGRAPIPADRNGSDARDRGQL